MYQAPAECFTEIASMRMIEAMAANISCMFPEAHGEDTFIHFIHKGLGGQQSSGDRKSTREHLSRCIAGGQEQGLGLLIEAAMQLGRGPARAAVKWPPALL